MDMIRILQFLVLAFGLKELFNAMEYHKQKKKKWVIASLNPCKHRLRRQPE